MIIKIFDITGNPLTQITESSDIKITNKLNDIWFASFTLALSDPNAKYEYLQEFFRVDFYKQIWNEEIFYWTWYIQWIEADFNIAKIKCKSFNWIWSQIVLDQDYNFIDKSFDFILETMLTDINNRWDTWITLDCWITNTISKSYDKWDTFYKTIRDLSLSWYEFKTTNEKLIFKTTIWEDKSSSVQFKFDYQDLSTRNIVSSKSKYNSDTISTAVLWRDNTDYFYKKDDARIWIFGLREKSFVIKWDWNQASQSELDESKHSIREIEIIPESQDYLLAGIWDMINVQITTESDLMSFIWDMKIVEQNYEEWDLTQNKFKIAKTKKKIIKSSFRNFSYYCLSTACHKIWNREYSRCTNGKRFHWPSNGNWLD